jgi:hypothetical protein
MSKAYELELEKTIEHLRKVIEEKNGLIDQQKELLDKFLKGEIVISNTLNGYESVGAGYVTAGPIVTSGYAQSGPNSNPQYTMTTTVQEEDKPEDVPF